MTEVKSNCKFFKGDTPCIYHKEKGVLCDNCDHFIPITKRILIIKLGAAGDVIRTTPLIRKLKEVFPQSKLTWLTYFPEVVPKLVDNILTFELKDILPLLATEFDTLYNLDKDREACGLANLVKAKIKKGFILKDGECNPIDEKAKTKWLTGLFDNLNRKNKKSYPHEIFEICGFKFNKEKYLLDKPEDYSWRFKQPKPLIGLNTGCGNRWKTRLWPKDNWIKLARKLIKAGIGVILLGGEQEDDKNKEIARLSKAQYLGFFSLRKFMSLVDQCNLIVTSVTMVLHIAIGLEKKILLLNNIFNRFEFELYGLGKIIEPKIDCLGCYKSTCEKNCMSLITPEEVFTEIDKQLVESNLWKK